LDYLESLLWKSVWTCRERAYKMNEMYVKLEFSVLKNSFIYVPIDNEQKGIWIEHLLSESAFGVGHIESGQWVARIWSSLTYAPAEFLGKKDQVSMEYVVSHDASTQFRNKDIRYLIGTLEMWKYSKLYFAELISHDGVKNNTGQQIFSDQLLLR
jgi:hypothetical protein